MKLLIYIVFIILFILVTFFGLGPVLMADGSAGERVATLMVVIVLYVILALLLRFFIKRVNNK
jgi:small-conductance mechanosensitive channel